MKSLYEIRSNPIEKVESVVRSSQTKGDVMWLRCIEAGCDSDVKSEIPAAEKRFYEMISGDILDLWGSAKQTDVLNLVYTSFVLCSGTIFFN